MTDAEAISSAAEPAAVSTGDQALIAALEAQIEVLSAQNAALLARVAELERRLGLNSSNSGKPPSSDGLKKPPRTRSLRDRSKKTSGGQTGHPGKTLCQVPNPDNVVEHFPTTCAGCGEKLGAPEAGYVARQVFDLPEPQPLLVTEHRAHCCHCAACGTRTRAAFPAGVGAPVQYGPRLAAFVVYLMSFQFLPEDRLTALMADLFGVLLSRATIAGMCVRAAERLAGFAAAVADLVASAPIKHLDETGFRIGGRTLWLHVAATMWLTFYRVAPQRGSLMGGLTGIVVHDHWKPYYTLPGVQHALCNAHHLRELKALVEIENEAWACRMQTLLRRAYRAVHLANKQEAVLSARMIDLITRRYDAVVADGTAWHKAQPPLAGKTNRDGSLSRKLPHRVGHNLLIRLSHRKDDVLRFLTNPQVPFTNNQAERDLRMMKLRQKISGGFRSYQGATDFAALRTMIGTAKKQGWNVIDSLMQNPDNLVLKLHHA